MNAHQRRKFVRKLPRSGTKIQYTNRGGNLIDAVVINRDAWQYDCPYNWIVIKLKNNKREIIPVSKMVPQ